MRNPAIRLPSAALLLLVALSLLACRVPLADDGPWRRVDVVSVEIDPDSGSPIMLLREREGLLRELPIWIGQFEALSIALATEGIPAPRPNSHDLIKSLLEETRGKLDRVVVTELRGNTYYAVIELEVGGRVVQVDSRPSDAIAVAIRTGTPIFASESVLHQSELIPDPENALEVQWGAPSDGKNTLPSRVSETASRPNA